MILTRSLSLTAAEQQRVEHIDQLVVRGAAGVDELIGALSDPSWSVRRAAVASLASLDEAVAPLVTWLARARTSEHAIAAAVDALAASMGSTATAEVMRLLDHPTPAVAADAATILGRRRAAEAAPRLGRLLAHVDDNVALAAIEALGAIGGNVALEALVDVLRTKSFFRTFPALQVLARTGNPLAIAPLAELLDDDVYRIEAARALGRTGSAQAIAPLTGLLARPGEAIVRLVALAFADLIAHAAWSGAAPRLAASLRSAATPHLARFVAALASGDAEERTAIAVTLGTIGDATTLAAVIPLLEDPRLRRAATEAMQQIARLYEAAMVEALRVGDPATRAALLPAVTEPRIAVAVRPLLVDDDPEVRARACDALARLGDVGAVPALFQVLEDPNPRVTQAASAAIQILGAAETPALLIEALANGSPALRRQALRIAAYLGSAETFEAVRVAIQDPDERLAELAISVLGTIDDPRADALLVELAHHVHDGRRSAAMRAAGLRPGDQMVELLERGLTDETAWVRYYACQGLGRVGRTSSTSVLVGRLADAMPHVRIAAIEAIARLDTPQAWQALLSVARSEDLDERRAALLGISHRDRAGALVILLEALASPDLATRLVALDGLARSSDERALASLAAAARDPEPELRAAALSLLVDRPDRSAAEILLDLALAAEPDEPVHHALSRPGRARITAVFARLSTAGDSAATMLAKVLARMQDKTATAALFEVLSMPSAVARRAAAMVLAELDPEGGRGAVARLAAEDPDPDVRRACAAAIGG